MTRSDSALRVPDGLLVGSGVSVADASIHPQAIYDGGLGGTKILLRIANGGAGQSGLIGAWADAFIQYCDKQGIPPFKVRLCSFRLLRHRNQCTIRLPGTLEIPQKAWGFSPPTKWT